MNANVNAIVSVGQLLQLSGVRDLLPQAPDVFSFKDELEAIETTLSKPFGLDITEAVAKTGLLLGDIFHNYKPNTPNEIIPFREILPGIAVPLLSKLEELNYWDIYNEPIPPKKWSFWESDESGKAEVIWLGHLKILWPKYFKTNDRLYGIAKIIFQVKPKTVVENAYRSMASSARGNWAEYATFVVKHGKTIREAYNPIESYRGRPSRDYDFGRVSPEEFRLFIIGLVIELIHIVCKSSQNNAFWENLKGIFPQQS